MIPWNPQPDTDLRVLRAAIAGSPIVVAPVGERRVIRDFGDWCEAQKPADLDRVILAWIASHVPARRLADLS